ncbi:tail length tape-measure protein [Streptococcus phage Javan174]|uniref:tape measure protein n=1 Tax=Streptococcus entericus TaxID=155680 RepID=UPI00037C1898|nr:tape measure protein [Streptococcus entericus]QBX24117.1 tail length tape-measure protein [Streptococcus phage Javan174]
MADGKVTITVDLDGTSAQQGVKQLKSLLQGLGESSSNGFNTGSKSALGFGTAMAVASAVVQKGMAMVSSSVGGAVNRVDTLNNFPKVMQSWGYSADDTTASMTKLSDGIDGLPTTLDDIVRTTQKLTTTTGDLGKATDLALAMNNAFIASGASSTLAANGLEQFSQMLAVGKVDAQAWRSVATAMPKTLQDVAEAFGYTSTAVGGDFYEALKSGEVSLADMSDKLIEMNTAQGGLAEQAKVAGQGIATSWSIAKTAVTRGVANIIQAFDAAAKSKGLGGISENILKLKPIINNAFNSFIPYVSKFVDVLSWVVDAAKRMWEAFKNTGAVTALTKAFSAIQGALEHVFSSLGQNTGFVEGLGKAFGEIVKWIAEAVTKAAEFISSLPPGTIQSIASAVLGAVAAFKGIKTAVSAVNSLKTAFGLLKATLTGNPFMLAAVALGALVGWFIHAYTTSETFRAKVDEVVAVVSKVAGKIKEFLSGVDPSLIAMLVPVLGLLLAKFKGFETISKFNPFSVFKKNAKDAFDGASGSASQSKGIIEQVFSGLGTLITSIAQGISTVLQGLATALSTVAQGFGTAAAMASPAQWLSMGAAMLMVGAGVALASAGIYVLVQAAIQLASAGSGAAIALVGLGVGIAAMAGVFALLGPALTASAVGMVAFGAAVALIGAGIGMAAAGLAMLASQLPTIAMYGMSASSAILALSGAVVAFGAGVMVAGAGLSVLSAGLIAFGASSVVAAAGGAVLAAGIGLLGLALKPVAASIKAIGQGFGSIATYSGVAVSAITSIATTLVAVKGTVQSSMNAMLNAFKSTGNQMKSQGSQIGQQTSQNLAKGISSGAGQVSSAMQTLTNAARSAGMSGVGAMQSVGAMIGQGLAQGMLSALGAVTAAANALVAQAERAAQAKAKIHSPSRLFRDGVGRFISQGVAVGITKDAYKVDDAMGDVFKQIQSFSFKAEDVIGVGKTKLSKVVQVKQELEQAVKASVEVAKEKSNDLLEKALDVAEKAVQRPAEMVLDDGTLVAKTGDKFANYQSEQIRRTNRMRGIRP